MIEAASLLNVARVFLIAWAVIVLLHGLLASLSSRGNPLPPETPEHHDH